MTRVASLLINQHALLLGFAVKNTLRGSRVTRVSLSVVASAPTEVPSKFLKNKRLVPESAPPSDPDLGLLYNFVNDSKKLVVLTGAGASTECGIPDYRSPHGAYSSGFKPITHQEFVRSEKARRRYWARSYAGWQKFNSVQPGATHKALANLEKKGRVYGMITQNVDRLHQKAGSNPIELHGTTHYVVCLSCGCITDRHLFQDRVKALNPEWALAIKHLEQGTLGKDPSVGLQVRPDGDIEIDEKFWEEKFYIPSCEGCGGVLKPNVVFFGDNVPRERANQAFSIVKEGDALLVVGSSLNTMSAYRLVNAARENCLPIAILNIGQTRADKLSTIKVEAHCGEALSRLLSMGSLAVPLINGLDFQRTDFPERCKDDYEAGFLIIDIVDAVLPSLEHEELNIIGQLQGNKLLSLTGEFGWKPDKDVLTRHRRNGRSQILTQDFLPYCI